MAGDSPRQFAQAHRNRAIAGVVLAMAIAAFNQTSVATALPLIVADLGSLQDYSWVLVASLVPAAVSAPAFGAAADRWGRRSVFVTAIGLFCVGAALAGASSSMWMLICSRVIHGVGMGGMMTLSQTLVADLVPLERRGPWVAALGAVFGAATVSGPLLGGWMADELGWRWVFYLSVPPALVALPIVWAFLRVPASAENRGVDVPGITAVTIAATAAMLALLWGGVRYDWVSPQIVALALVTVLLIPLAWHLETRRPDPLIDLAELRSPVVALCSIAALLSGAILFGTVLFIPLYIQGVRGGSVTASGAWLIWFVIAFAAAAAVSGRYTSRRHAWAPTLLVGGACTVPGMWLAGALQPDGTLLNTVAPLVVLGVGLGMVIPAVLQLTQMAVEPRRVARATALHQFVRSFGGAVGIAVVGALINNRTEAAVRERTPDALEPRLAELETHELATLELDFDQLAEAYVLTASIRTALHDVVTLAFRETTIAAALLAIVCALLARRFSRSGAPTRPPRM